MRIGAWWRTALETIRPALRIDGLLLLLLATDGAIYIPLAGRATANPQLLYAFSNDEPLITLQLVGMAMPPYGDPANLLDGSRPMPDDWGSIHYSLPVYYGGVYLGLAFLVFGPLKLMGFPDFPTAPILLRGVSILSGMLCLTLLYNLGRRIGSRAVGFAAGLLLIADASFFYYSTNIHPDTTQAAMALLALWPAMAHARTGDLRTLTLLAIVVGLVHGSKMGGPWMVPLGVAAVAWGTAHGDGQTPRRPRWRLFILRTALLGAVSVLSFALTTPYAVLDSYYFRALGAAWTLYKAGSFDQAGFGDWMAGIWRYEGPILGVAVAGGLLSALVSARRDRDVALCAVLCLSSALWYVATVRLWLNLPYLLTSFALAGLLAVRWVIRVADVLAVRARPLRWVVPALALALAYPTVSGKLRSHVAQGASLTHLDRYTTVEVGRWARDHIPNDAKIVVDDLAYFDPRVFPNVILHGGLLTYEDLERYLPDYFVLSGSIYDAPHYVELRRTQGYNHGNEGPFSVLLYQDLLDRGGTPKAELMASFSASPQTGLVGTAVKLYRWKPAHRRRARSD